MYQSKHFQVTRTLKRREREHKSFEWFRNNRRFSNPFMAAIGSYLRISPYFNPTNRNAATERTDGNFLWRMSFSSASSNVFGEKVIASNFKSVQQVRRRSEARKPLVVSPKAVSDSQNSQTCLDPDASRVSFTFMNLCFF